MLETDEEDEELDVEMEAEITDDELLPANAVRRPQSKHATSNQQTQRVDKGKGRAVSPVEDTNVAKPAGERRLKPGPLSDEAKAEIAEFSRRVLSAADSIGEVHGKTRSDILSAAGLGHVKSSRTVNPVNAYRKWHKVHCPKPDDGASLRMISL